jgi:multiple sugar transport system substrate-binding protein
MGFNKPFKYKFINNKESRSMNKKSKAILIMGMSFSLLMAGCSKSGSNNGSPSPLSPADSAASGTTAPDTSKKVSLRIGTWEGGDGLKIQQQIADNYKKAHSNVEISIESVPDQYGTKLLTQIAANQAPDIFQIGDGDISMFKDKGAIADLTSYIGGSNGIKTDDYYQAVLDVGKIDGKYYTMPKDYSDLGVYYNKKLFDEAKVAYPQPGWTWDQLVESAKKLNKKNGDKITQWGVGLPGGWMRAVLPLINSYGGSVISADGTKFEGFINSNGTVKALQLYHDMYFKDHLAPSSVETEALKGVDLFAAGKTAMSVTGRWPVTDYSANSALSYGVVQMPVGPSGAANTICYAGYGLYSKSANKDAAWDYLKYLTGPEGQALMAQHAFTAVKSVATKLGQTKDEHLKPFLDDIPNIKPFPEKINSLFANSGGKAVQGVLDKMMLGGNIDVKKELDNAAKTAESDLKTLKSQ